MIALSVWRSPSTPCSWWKKSEPQCHPFVNSSPSNRSVSQESPPPSSCFHSAFTVGFAMILPQSASAHRNSHYRCRRTVPRAATDAHAIYVIGKVESRSRLEIGTATRVQTPAGSRCWGDWPRLYCASQPNSVSACHGGCNVNACDPKRPPRCPLRLLVRSPRACSCLTACSSPSPLYGSQRLPVGCKLEASLLWLPCTNWPHSELTLQPQPNR